MGVRKHVLYLAAAGLMAGSAFAATPGEASFSALQNVEAEALSQNEMQQITGQLNAYDIGNALLDAAANAANPVIKNALTKLGDYYINNAAAINAFYAKLGILTPCKSCS